LFWDVDLRRLKMIPASTMAITKAPAADTSTGFSIGWGAGAATVLFAVAVPLVVGVILVMLVKRESYVHVK
jgi:hypothetical protein